MIPETGGSGGSFFRFETSDSYAIGLMAIVLITVAVCHLVVRLRTDPVLRRSSFRGLIESNSDSKRNSGISESYPVSGESPQPRPAASFGFVRRGRGELMKETTLATR